MTSLPTPQQVRAQLAQEQLGATQRSAVRWRVVSTLSRRRRILPVLVLAAAAATAVVLFSPRAPSPSRTALHAVFRRDVPDGAHFVFAPGSLQHIDAPRTFLRLEEGGVELSIPEGSRAWTLAAGGFLVSATPGSRAQVTWDRRKETLSVALAIGRAVLAGRCAPKPFLLAGGEQGRFRCASHLPAASPSVRTPERAEAHARALTLSPIAHWRFDEGGTHARDRSGHGHDAAWLSEEAIVAGALFPERSPALVPITESLRGLSSFTLAAWVFRERDGLSFDVIVSRQLRDTAGEHFALACYQNRLVFLLGTRPAEITLMDWGLFPNGRWVHVAATYDGRSAALYLDGERVGSREATLTPVPDDNPLVIGGNANGAGRAVTEAWHGGIKELVIYPNALSAGDIRALARALENR